MTSLTIYMGIQELDFDKSSCRVLPLLQRSSFHVALMLPESQKKNKNSGVPTCSTEFRTSLQSECTTKCYNQLALAARKTKDDHDLDLTMMITFFGWKWLAAFEIIAPERKSHITTIIPFCEDNH